MDRLTALNVFRHVVALGSFAEAARRLRMSPAAISKNVAELEAHLAVRLLNRTTRRMSLTEAGELYHHQIARILDELDEADTALGPLQASPTGRLKVSAPVTLTLVSLSSAIPRFLDRYPELTLDLRLDDRRVNLVEEGFDLAIRASDRLEDSSLIARRLATIPHVVCATPSYLEKHGVPDRPEDLAGHVCIQFTLSGHVDEWVFSNEKREARVSIDGRYKVTSSLAVRDALLAGFGLSLIPSAYVREDVEEGRLRVVLTEWSAVQLSVYAVYPSRRYMVPKVRAFLDFLAQELGDG